MNPVLSPVAAPNDGNASRHSQALYSTPQGQINAFSIFARRRRPQVSAQNQMMHTGEISKILAREWNAMGVAEKQVYVNQADQLRFRESFGLKYPNNVINPEGSGLTETSPTCAAQNPEQDKRGIAFPSRL